MRSRCPAKLWPIVERAARIEGTQNAVGAGQRLGRGGRVVRLDVEIGAAGHRQAVLHARVAGDLDVVGAVARGDEVLDLRGDVGRPAHAGGQHVAVAVDQGDLHVQAVQALGHDRRALARR